MDSRVASALEAAFPGRGVADVRATGPSWNDANRTVGVEFADGGTVYLKVAADGDGSRVARERAVVAYAAANCGVSVPEVVASDPDAEVPYLATAPLPGRPLIAEWADADEAEREALAREVGAALAAVHAARFDEHGHVTGGGADGLELDTAPWTDVLVDTVERTRALASDDRFDHHFDEVIAAVEANRALLDDAPAALVHGDPAQPNCVRTADGVGFLDWEIAHVGDPAREVYRARDQQFDPPRGRAPRRVVDAFHDGYRERAGGLPDGYHDRRPVYEAVRFLGVSGFFDKYVEFVDESRGELADWVEAEMDRRLSVL
jgi:aminoglycoside phosphotransferase (APT) family kinase protein